jgi:hypothetical protein
MPTLLILTMISMTGCESVSAIRIKPKTSAAMDQCVDAAYDSLPPCVQEALKQWLVCTQ